MTKCGFKLNDDFTSPILESVFLSDEVGIREIIPHEIKEFFDFKDQLTMMDDEMAEMCFNNLVYHAKELEKAFKKCKKAIKSGNKER